jgi:membrane protein YdbS with pleckstrin-like domain
MDDTSQALSMDAGDMPVIERKEAESLGVKIYTAHWQLFLPVFFFLFLYALIWLMLSITGQSTSFSARFFIVGAAILLPLLAASAFLKFQTIRLQISEDSIAFSPGWPVDHLSVIKPEDIRNVEVSVSGLSALLGGGNLLIRLVDDNEEIVIPKLADPYGALSAIQNT